MEKDREKHLLQESLQRMKAEKMDWDFGDFLNQTKDAKSEEILPTARRKPRMNTAFLALAASLALVFGIFFIVKYFNGKNSAATSEMVRNEIIRQKKSGKLADTPGVAANSVAANDSIKKRDTLEIRSEKKTETADEEALLNKILPRRGRLKRPRRALMAQNSPARKSYAAPDSTGYVAGYVTVNGKKIDNEKEAIKIARGALNRMSAGLSKTLTEVDFQDSPGN